MSNRPTVTALAVLSVLLLVIAPGAQAINTSAQSASLVVGSQWTDFGTGDDPSPNTLDNLTVSGTDESATVTLDAGVLADSFEDQPADSGPPEDWTKTGDSNGTVEVTTTEASDGSQSVYIDDPSGSGPTDIYHDTQPYDTAKTSDISVSLYQSTSTETRLNVMEDGSNVIPVGMRNGDLQYYDGSGWQTISTTPDRNEWVHLTITDIDPAANTYTVEWSTSTDSGQATGLSSETDIENGYTEVRLRGFGGGGYFDDFSPVGTPASATYVGATHEVSNAESAAIDIEQASNVTVEPKFRAVDSNGNLVRVHTGQDITSTGNHTIDLATTFDQNDYADIETVLNVDVTGTNPQFELADESILFNNHAPTASDVQPVNGTKATQQQTTLSLDVDDQEFGTAQGETVDVTFKRGDGTTIGSETLQSPGTANTTVDVTGSLQWYAVLDDSWGGQTTTDTRTLTTPGQLDIRNALNKSLVAGANLTVTFFGGEDGEMIVRRSSSDGTIDLTGLPTGTEFTASVSADGYFTRSVIIPSLYEQANIWLLPRNASGAVEVTFRIDDRTGDFSGTDNTQLRVQRPIAFDNQTVWRDVTGDSISATSDLSTYLQNGQRYRLIIQNDQQTRILGSYTPSGPVDPEVIPIGRVQFDGDLDSGVAVDASLLTDPSPPAVRVMYHDPDLVADQVIYRVQNVTSANSTTVIPNTTASTLNEFTTVTSALPANTTVDGSTYRVDVWAYDNGQLVAQQTARIGELPGVTDGWMAGVSKHILTLAGYVFLVASSYGIANYSPRLGALAGVMIGVAFTIYGILGIPHVVLGFTGTIVLIQNAANTAT